MNLRLYDDFAAQFARCFHRLLDSFSHLARGTGTPYLANKALA
jgi:hypothetical protein